MPVLKSINKISVFVFMLICGIIYLILPSVATDSLVDGTQSGKTFFFLFLILMMPIFIILKSSIVRKSACFMVNKIDIVLLLFMLYVIGNAFLHNSSISLLFLEFCGLCVLYFILRQTANHTIFWLYAALILGGFGQAIYGNLQLWGYYPSHHNVFKITGSFFNPGPYAGYLSGALTVTFGFYTFKANLFPQKILKLNWQKLELIRIILLLMMAFMALALAATHSRAAFLAFLIPSAYLVYEQYKHRFNVLFKWPILKKISLVTAAFTLIACILAGLYYFKKDSANGRLLIWHISLIMIKDKPLFGYGFDQFKANYMNYQASFFAENPDADEALVTGDTNYAFNEPLQLTVENGIVGLLIIFFFFVAVFNSNKKNSQTEKQHLSLTKYHTINKDGMIVIAKAGIISIVIFSLFSYPGQILPVKTSLVLFMATIANYSTQTPFCFKSSHKFISSILFPVKLILAVVFLFIAGAGTIGLYKLTSAFKHWQSASQYYQFGAYDESIQNFAKAYPLLKTNGDFLTNYGKALSEAGKPQQAISILKKAEKKYPNTIVYTALGDSYKELKQYLKAEQAYLYAWHMNPSRFYPKYLLAKLYAQSEQKEKAIAVANELLHKKVKVESKAIREIKTEMNEILRKNIR